MFIFQQVDVWMGAFYRCSFTKLIIVVITQPFTPSSPRLRRTYSERTPPTSAPGSPFATPRHIPGIPRGNFHLERYVRSFSSGTTSSVSRDSPSPAGDSTPSRDSPRSSVSSGNASPIGKSPWKSRSSYTWGNPSITGNPATHRQCVRGECFCDLRLFFPQKSAQFNTFHWLVGVRVRVCVDLDSG